MKVFLSLPKIYRGISILEILFIDDIDFSINLKVNKAKWFFLLIEIYLFAIVVAAKFESLNKQTNQQLAKGFQSVLSACSDKCTQPVLMTLF